MVSSDRIFKHCVHLFSCYIAELDTRTALVHGGGVPLETKAHFSLYFYINWVPLCAQHQWSGQRTAVSCVLLADGLFLSNTSSTLWNLTNSYQCNTHCQNCVCVCVWLCVIPTILLSSRC